MLGAIVASVLAGRAAGDDIALVLDAELTVEGALLDVVPAVPTAGGVASCSRARPGRLKDGRKSCAWVARGLRHRGDELVSIGLGSCVGVALVDPAAAVAAVARRRMARTLGNRRLSFDIVAYRTCGYENPALGIPEHERRAVQPSKRYPD